MANSLTVNGLRARWSGKDLWRSDGVPRGGGRLVARIMKEGVAFYFQYFLHSLPRQGSEAVIASRAQGSAELHQEVWRGAEGYLEKERDSW